jgi:hypothetical protein
MKIDLRGTTFEDFVQVIFDHPAGGEPHSWFHALDDVYSDESLAAGDIDYVARDPALQVAHLAQLFRAPREALARFTPEQINAGFWFMGSAENDAFLLELWNPLVPRADRITAARQIPTLYSDLFLPLDLDEHSEMMGDFLVKDVCDFAYPQRVELLDVDGMRDVFLSVFHDVLQVSDPRAWAGALHGLGHLRHPAVATVIEPFLAATPALPHELREYAQSVLAGDRIL